MQRNNKTGYVDVNGLHMYYEIHGEGKPLLLLHGEFATASMFATLIPQLAQSHQVIVVEQQGHGHTADINRPLNFAQMAKDTAGLLKQLGIQQSDVFGYSGGGTVALQLAVQFPSLVKKIVVASTIYDEKGYLPGVMKALKNPDPDAFPPELRTTYEKVAPEPKNWSSLVYKSSDMAKHPADAGFLTATQIQKITLPALVLIGDADFIDPDYTKTMAQLLHAEFKVISGDHSSYITTAPQTLLSILKKFFANSR